MAEPFIFADGQTAQSVEDLIQLCLEFPDDSINYLIREDFEKWLIHIGATEVAEYAAEARQASVEDSQKLNLFITKYQTQPQEKIAATNATTMTPKEAKPRFNWISAIANVLKNSSEAKTQNDNKPVNT